MGRPHDVCARKSYASTEYSSSNSLKLGLSLIGSHTFSFVCGVTTAYPSIPKLSVAPVIPVLYIAAVCTTGAMIENKEEVLLLWTLVIPVSRFKVIDGSI